MCTRISFIDASAEGYEEEEVYEEEEENFDHCTTQGKLILMKSNIGASYIDASYYNDQVLLVQAILVQASKDTIAIYLFRESYQSQVFILQAFTFIYQSPFIVYLCLSLALLQELQV